MFPFSSFLPVLFLATQLTAAQTWQSPARWRRLPRSIPGTLSIAAGAVEFHSAKANLRWPYTEIATFDLLTPHTLILTGYTNRPWHQPGDRRYRFHLADPLSPTFAAELARRVAKPSRNGEPVASSTALPARHRTAFGGSNGILQFNDDGIAYTTPSAKESRAWRWADIESLAHSSPYQFRIAAFRETFDFELKQPLPPALFDRLWDRLNAPIGGTR